MRVFIIKHKGANTWGNMFFDRELTFSDGNKINTGLLFSLYACMFVGY